MARYELVWVRVNWKAFHGPYLLTLRFRSRCLFSILCIYQMASMAGPRKFSDKIALLTQKQIEGNAAFDAILREVSATTRVALL